MASGSVAESNKAAAEIGSPVAGLAPAEGGEHDLGSMAGDIVYLKTEIKRLENIIETRVLVDDIVDEEKAIETSEALKSAAAPTNRTVDEMAARDAAVDDVAVVDELETGGDEATTKKKKKKKKRAKAKGRGAKVWNWCHGNLTKITAVGSLAIVLLVSATFGQGLLGDQFPSLRKGADRTRSLSGADTVAPSNAPKAFDDTSTPSSSEQPSSSIKPSALVVPSTSLQPVSSSLDGCMSDPNNCGCSSLHQTDYRGSINVTSNGIACQRWDQTLSFWDETTDSPGKHFANAGLEENFCRNPYTFYRGAGCMTIEGNWDYCDVPICEASHAPEASDAMTTPPSSGQPNKRNKPTTTSSVIPSISTLVPSTSLQPVSSSLDGCMSDPNTCGCINKGQVDYRGSINETQDGVACMRWDEAFTSGGQTYKEFYPDSGLEENFCRNPEHEDERAWCYTTLDPEVYGVWDYCNVPICKASCFSADPENCGCEVLIQNDYRGSISTTRSGYTCQRWDSRTPHVHDQIPKNFPDAGLEDNNYCRNPTGDPEGAWCHTTDPDTGKDYCTVPYCTIHEMASERRALLEIRAAANGEDWFNNWGDWLDGNSNHCSWYGVTCNDETPRSIIRLDLSNNGMRGTLSKSIGNLRSLKRLVLSDNNIEDAIPTEIGDLLDLEFIDLSHNSFQGHLSRDIFKDMHHLEQLRLHGNKLTGSVEIAASDALFGPSSLVADCGKPSMFEEPIMCKGCTMCCNSQGLCTLNKKHLVEKWGLTDFQDFTIKVFLGTVIVFSCAMAVSSLLYDKYKSCISPRMNRSASFINREEEYALNTIGKDSVYQFFLGSSQGGWAIALATIGAQIWILVPFLEGTDPVYSWLCPPGDVCSDMNEGDLDLQGWVLFGILTIAHLLKDIINGSKMIILSGKEMHGGWSRVRYFFGGFCMLFITSFTLYVSAIFNKATATSNAELIINSVIIVFVITVDEYIYAILKTMSPRGVEKMSSQVQEQGQETQLVSAAEKRKVEGLEELKQQNDELKEKVERFESEIDDILSQLDLLTQGRVDATVAQATQGSEGDGTYDERED